MRRAVWREWFVSKGHVLDLLDGLGADLSDEFQARDHGFSALERWADGHSALHLHCRVGSRWKQIEPGEWCARLEVLQAGRRGLLVNDLATDAGNPHVQLRRGGVTEQHYPVLVPVRDIPKQLHRPSAYRAVIRLIPLEECSVGIIWDAGDPVVEDGAEVFWPFSSHWKGDALLLEGCEPSAPHLDETPNGVVERSSEIVDHVSDCSAVFESDIWNLFGDQVGDEYAAAQAPFNPYVSHQGLGFIVRPELSVERLEVFEAPFELEVAALEGLHDA